MATDVIMLKAAFLCVALFLASAEESDHVKDNLDLLPRGNPERCAALLGRKVSTFEVLPGFGWDNLANDELGQVFDFQYKKCKLTRDGVYLIPDSVNVIPTKESNVGLYSEFMDSMTSYKSLTSFSINGQMSAGVGLNGSMGISGSFGSGYGTTKLHMSQVNSKAIISRVSAKYNRYKVTVQPDAPLSVTFRTRILDIAKSYQLNDHSMGRYLSQMFVRDFGTHVITNVDAGAIFMKEDVLQLDSSSSLDTDDKNLAKGAALSFAGIFPTKDGIINVTARFGVGVHDGSTDDAIAAYTKHVSHSTITAFGGSVISPSSPGNGSWSDSLVNNLVTIDRRGQAIQELITPFNFPEIPQSIAVDTQHSVRNAFVAYYRHNTYRGCTDPKAKNFDIMANVDSGACQSTVNDNIFGGAYQSCNIKQSDAGNICSSYEQKNPVTGDFSCPSGYVAVLLVSHDINQAENEKHCKGVWFWKRCTTTTKHSSATIHAYWCAADDTKAGSMEMYFGGIYTSTRPNDRTGKQSCPGDDSQVVTIMDDIHICLESNAVESYGFGGLFSCQYGNRMAAKSRSNSSIGNLNTNFPKMCPPKFSQKFIKLVDDCEVEFCSNLVQTTPFRNLPVLQRPPFIKHPYPNKYVSSDLVLLSDEGAWFKNERAYEKINELQGLETKMKSYKKSSDSLAKLSVAWSELAPAEAVTEPTLSLFASDSTDTSNSSSDDNLSTPIIAVIATLATVCCILITTLVIVMKRRRVGTCGGPRAFYQEVPNFTTTGQAPKNVEKEAEINILIQPTSYGASQ